MMELIIMLIARYWHYVVAMPNTRPPILNAEDVERYRQEIILAAADACPENILYPVMAIQITPKTTPRVLKEARKGNAMLGKVYPFGVTTNSDNGVSDYHALEKQFRAMEECGMVLSLHPEMPDPAVQGLHKEKAFIRIIEWIVETFPNLNVVVEHVTDADMVATVKRLYDAGANIAATITLHHLYLTLDHVIGYAAGTEKMKPHHFCKPIAKLNEDRFALRDAVLSGHPAFFFGSDSAAHLKGQKECAECCAGVFTAPVMLPLLAEFFEQHGKLALLEGFVSIRGAEFYGLPVPEKTITLLKMPWTVPEEYFHPEDTEKLEGVVPFKAGEEISWRINHEI